MTLRQKMLLKKLPENGYNVSKTMKQCGYSDITSVSGAQYQSIRRLTSKLDFFSEEKIKKDIGMTFKLARRKEDITNMARINEHRSKIAGMITDKSEITKEHPNTIVFINKTIDSNTPKDSDSNKIEQESKLT